MKRSLRIRRFAAALLIPALLCLAGCRSHESPEASAPVSAEPGALERQGLAWARVLTAPLCLVSFSYAECESTPAGFFIFPFVCAWTIPAGALATAENLAIGTLEILLWQQCPNVIYPWQTFDPKAPHEWNVAARQAFENVMAERGGDCSDGSCRAYEPPPKHHRSHGGHGGHHRSSGGSKASSGGGSHHRSSSGKSSGGGDHRSHSRGGRSSRHDDK